MSHQSGFTLFELMIAISIVAILSAIAIPAYQGYLQKAALTDLLQTLLPYKNSVELCLIETSQLSECENNKNGIPASRQSRYIASITITNSVITTQGRQSLADLTVTLTPSLNAATEQIDWQRVCQSTQDRLQQSCQDTLRF